MANIVYVKDGKEIAGDAWIEYDDPAAGTLSCQPMNMTPSQMTAAGVTVVPQQPMPDEFYGPVEKDPDNPGGWIQTPYPPEEMQVRLHDYSAGIRSGIENGGMVMTGGDYVTPSTRDIRAMYTTGSHNAGKNDKSLTVKVYAIVDGIPSDTPTFMKMSKKNLDQMETDLTEFADQCFAVEASTGSEITAGTITTKDEIDAAYAPMKRRSPKRAPSGI
jgi:hypothetical protein